MTRVGLAGDLRHYCLVAACVMLAAFLLSCAGDDTDAANTERLLLLESKAHSFEESLEAQHEENEAVLGTVTALRDENAALISDLAALKQAQAEYVQQKEVAEAALEHEKEVADFEEVQEQQLADLEANQARTSERLDELDEQVSVLEEGEALTDERLDELDTTLWALQDVVSQVEWVLPALEKWFTGIDKRLVLLESTGIGRTLSLAAEGGGQAQVINYGAAYGGARPSVLVLPDPLPEEEIPLIVSLHGFGGDSFVQSLYIPLHKRVNRDRFALLLPNGIENAEGQRFWNPTDGSGQADQDDVGALTALVQEASEEFNMGPVYFFGYSNGGFMAYHLACRGMPGLRAVASLAGTRYYGESQCYGAPPVSVLHIHGTDDQVILYGGDVQETSQKGDSEPAFYAGAEEMVSRWALGGGCEWPLDWHRYAALDLNEDLNLPETSAYRLSGFCDEGIDVQLWMSEGSGHSPGYGDAFVDALVDWLLSQQ